ncbi:FAD-dependent monooxygenase [Nocardia sp. NPDC049149]|uniref:FAD-dependent monooxygenase n=1 Tax=Nocardia sp. NPDC049149 TaxID=3364315 RepID=UPI003710BAAF
MSERPTGTAEQPVDVLIVGAGPVGLTLAIALADNGVRSRIIDKLDGWSELSKAMTLTPRTLECFRMLGLADRFLADGILSRRIHHYTERRNPIAVTDLAKLDGEFHGVLHLSQSRTIGVLAAALAERGIEVERGRELTEIESTGSGHRSTVTTADGAVNTIAARYVVGADGSRSRVRELIGTAFDGAEQSETFIMADIEMAGFPYHPEDRHAFYLDEGTFFTILPIDGRYFRLISTCRIASAEVDEEFILRRFDALLRTVGLAHVKLGDPFWLTRFNPRQYLAEQLHANGVFLVGDAAHIQSPIGAQGLNTGIQDSMNLAWKLGVALRHGGTGVLNSYHEERHPVAQRLFEYNNVLSERIFGRNRLKRQFLRYQNYLLRLPSFHAEELAKVSQYRVGYPAGGLFARPTPGAHPAGPRLRVGDRMPHCVFETADGTPFQLLIELGACRHLLLVFAGEDLDAPETVAARGQSEVTRYVVYDRPSPRQRYRRPEGADVLFDRSGRSREQLEVPPHTSVLIRPDGYIAALFRNGDHRALETYWDLITSTTPTQHPEDRL